MIHPSIRYALYWPAAARLSAVDNMDVLTKGGLDVAFASAAQIDSATRTLPASVTPTDHGRGSLAASPIPN